MEEYQDFQSEIFCLTVPNISVGQSFTLAIISGIEKVWIREGGRIKIFRRSFFVSQSLKISVGEAFTVAKISGFEKNWIKRGGGYQDFTWKNFCLTGGKFP